MKNLQYCHIYKVAIASKDLEKVPKVEMCDKNCQNSYHIEN